MEVGVGFEPTALGICSPLHWATLPPNHGAVFWDRTRFSGSSDRREDHLHQNSSGADDGNRTHDLILTKDALLPTEPHQLTCGVSIRSRPETTAFTGQGASTTL